MGRDTTLLHATLGDMGLARKTAAVVLGTLFIALAAQISVPFFPVPMTLQTLAILTVGFTFGSRLGAVTLLAYLAEGAAGLPVFANGLNAVAFAGPTAGFLLGFVGLAWGAGYAAERGWARGVVSTTLVALVLSALLYIPGAAWPLGLAALAGIDAGWAGLSAAGVWGAFVAPFLLGDVVKAVIVALVVGGGWKALKRA